MIVIKYSYLFCPGMDETELAMSKEVLEEIFNEQEKVVMYRAHLEIEKANQGRQNAASTSDATTQATGEG